MLVMAMAMVAFMWAGYGSRDMKLATGTSRQDDESVGRLIFHEEAGDAFDLDEPTRRMLDTATYIGYKALDGNKAPCPSEAAGQSYYSNCATTGTRVFTKRTCDAITRCTRT